MMMMMMVVVVMITQREKKSKLQPSPHPNSVQMKVCLKAPERLWLWQSWTRRGHPGLLHHDHLPHDHLILILIIIEIIQLKSKMIERNDFGHLHRYHCPTHVPQPIQVRQL